MTNSTPAAEMVWVVRARHASTTDGAARSATSRIAPGPLSSATAVSKDAVGEPGHHAHGRIGLPGQQRYLEVQVVVVVGADHRLRVGHTGGGQVVRRLHGGDARSGIGQLVDDPDPQRVVAADDEVAGHASTLLKKTSPRRVKMGHGR